MQFIDLHAQQSRIREKLNENINNVLDHGKYIMGPEVSQIEAELKEYVNAKCAISCSSGTDALLLALMAYNVGPGDAVFTTPFTFIATAEVIQLLGATPVFVDIENETFNIDPDQLDKAISAVKSGNDDDYLMPAGKSAGSYVPRVVIAVDLFGLPANYEKINLIAKKHGLDVIQDAAQSFGAESNGKRAGSMANVGCTSFFPAKPLGCYGDGGMCFTNDESLADIMSSLRIHGKGSNKYDNIRVGVNARMDTIQAAILLAKFEIFPEELELRQQVSNRYSEQLKSYDQIQIPVIPDGMESAWAQYSILTENEAYRNSLQARLRENGIPSAIYYPKPLHLQTAFASLGYRNGDFRISESCSKRVLSLPMHPYLTEEEQEKIVDVIVTSDE